MNINSHPIQAFLVDRGYGSQNRLYIKNKELRYGDIGCGYRFAAKLGFGNASMSNVAKFIRENQDTCFANTNEIKSYNNFIAMYNSKQSFSWKKAEKAELYPHSEATLSKDEAHDAIKTHLETCKLLIQDETQHLLLVDTCEELQKLVEEWSFDENISKDEKNTLNAILELKNQIRNSLFPPKDSPLKGLETPQMPTNLSDEDKQRLRASLKEMRTAVLKAYFHDRLQADTVRLHALKKRFHNHGPSAFQESQFLKEQLDQWQEKLDNGKPIAIPKWYHCTKDADTLDTILKTDILFMHKGAFPGAFVSSRPAPFYGDYCFMLSEHIEKTGTKGDNGPLYPIGQGNHGRIHFTNSPKVAKNSSKIKNNQGLSIWLGFQKGKDTLDPDTGIGTEGIPMQRDERIKCGNLKYYKDTTTAFIFHQTDDPALQKIGQDSRVKVLTNSQAEALKTLINATFYITLPTDWKGKV